MKKFRLILAALAMSFVAGGAAAADETFVNLTPMPKQMTVGTGSWKLPAGLKVSTAGLPAEMSAEVTKFVTSLNAGTGLGAAATTDATADVTVTVDKALAAEAYTLKVTANGVAISASTPTGLYFAFQSIKKMLPANVMAELPAQANDYALPVVDIADEPRYEYRGFMLDVCRHFFTVDEVKRMIDVMSYYKLNRFHWHLTEDQGWRIEMPDYPKLMTVGATAPNSRFTDMWSKTQYWINRPYGPYFYTQDELRDVVAYAKERHIEVIPEVDMPGHMAAVVAAYPEFSCYPDRQFQVWSDGGVSSAEVLNVANPQVIKFVKDVITTLADIFPYENIHIGGDECPTTAWADNADCQKMKKDLGLTTDRQIQSYFIKQMADHAATLGRKISVWNESVTAEGADIPMVQETDATVYCWYPPDQAAQTATNAKLRSVYTCWGPYYINRTQNAQDPPGAGTQTDDVKATYERKPFQSLSDPDGKYCYGIQGTFWTEHVSDREYMEYLALPRLIAIAEAAWTPQSKRNFNDFITRVNADTKLLDLRGYQYSKYYLTIEADPGTTTEAVLPDPAKWYRLMSNCSDAARAGKCIELMASGDNAGKLWQASPAAEGAANYDYQFFRFVEDPANAGHYAMVCKAKPNGSVNTTPTAQNNLGRWTYNESALNYDFTLTTSEYYGETSAGSGVYYYAIHSTKQNDGYYMNFAAAGQSYSINCYSNPADGNSGLITLMPEDGAAQGAGYQPFDAMQQGKTYAFTNTLADFAGCAIADDGTSALLSHSDDPWASTAWTVESVKVEETNAQTVTLRNAATGRYVGALSAYSARQGKPVTVSDATAAPVTIYRTPDTADGNFTITVGGSMLWPMPFNSPIKPGCVSSGSTTADAGAAPALLGSVWTLAEVRAIPYVCTDTKGADLGTKVRTVAMTASNFTDAEFCPVIKNHTLKSATYADGKVACVYERNAVVVTYHCVMENGVIAGDIEDVRAVGEAYTVAAPEVEFFTVESMNPAAGTKLTLDTDATVEVTVSTEAIAGVKNAVKEITERADLVDNHLYLIQDNDPRYGYERAYFRTTGASGASIGGVKSEEGASPYAVWRLVAQEGSANFAIQNVGNGLYVPVMTSSVSSKMVANPAPFTLTYKSTWTASGSNGQAGWQIKNATNNIAWDGNANGDMAGYDDGQPHNIYTFEMLPHFTVEIIGLDHQGNTIHNSKSFGVGGESFYFLVPVIEGYTVKSVTGNEGVDYLKAHTVITVTYEPSDVKLDDISAPEAGAETIFDLQGRRLSRISAPGVYIVAGKKLLVK